MPRRASRTLLLFLVALAGLAAVTAGAATAESGDARSLCKTSLLRRPLLLTGHFGLYNTRAHPDITAPTAEIEYRFRKVPPECRGVYEAVLEVKVSYRTTRYRWKTMREYTPQGLKSWKSFFPYQYASHTEAVEYAPAGYPYVFGRVTAVKASARILFVDSESQRVLGRKPLGKVRMTFTPRRRFR